MPKGEREFQITFHETPIGRLSYNWETGAIELPNYGVKITVSNEDIDSLFDNFTHEIMHKYIHENINGFACEKWDDIDKIPNTKVYRLSSLGISENDQELKFPNIIFIE